MAAKMDLVQENIIFFTIEYSRHFYFEYKAFLEQDNMFSKGGNVLMCLLYAAENFIC